MILYKYGTQYNTDVLLRFLILTELTVSTKSTGRRNYTITAQQIPTSKSLTAAIVTPPSFKPNDVARLGFSE